MEYAFNATALGLGGAIERGHNTTLIPSLGSVVLPSTGGVGTSEIFNYRSDEVSFSMMQTRVGGSRIADGLYSAYSDILMRDVNLFDRVFVRQMQLTLTSTRRVVEGEQGEARFEIRASYGGVRIDEDEVIPELDLEMCSLETYGQFLQIASEEPERIAEKLDQPPTQVTAMVQPRPIPPVVRSSIVQKVHSPEVLCNRRNKLHVPGLGALHFGELLLKQGRRRVNLLRLDYGDIMQEGPGGDGGSIVMASGEGNGTPVWPQQ
ncbi:MAG TPA: hypothetical protein VF787_01625 [Thermoanaerobaculia bacterium]